MRKYDLDSIDLKIDSVEPWDNEKYKGMDIHWYSNIGFGQYRFYCDKKNPEEWFIESEMMDGMIKEDGTEDKDFGKKLLNIWLNSTKVID